MWRVDHDSLTRLVHGRHTRSGAAAPTSAALAASAAAPSASSHAGYAFGGGGTPAGATTHAIIDVDDDGKADTGWATSSTSTGGTTTFGVTTASGATFSAPFRSASPIGRSALFGNANGKGQIVMIATDGRQASLFAITSCAIKVVNNQQGQQYTFDLGPRTGKGHRGRLLDAAERRRPEPGRAEADQRQQLEPAERDGDADRPAGNDGAQRRGRHDTRDRQELARGHDGIRDHLRGGHFREQRSRCPLSS